MCTICVFICMSHIALRRRSFLRNVVWDGESQVTTEFALRLERVGISVAAFADVLSRQFERHRHVTDITRRRRCQSTARLQRRTASYQPSTVTRHHLHSITHAWSTPTSTAIYHSNKRHSKVICDQVTKSSHVTSAMFPQHSLLTNRSTDRPVTISCPRDILLTEATLQRQKHV